MAGAGPTGDRLRFDRYRYRFYDVGESTAEDRWILGLTGLAEPGLKGRLNYVRQDTRSPLAPDPADNSLLALVQLAFCRPPQGEA